MLTQKEAEKLLEEFEPKIKECVLATADLEYAVESTSFHAVDWNRWFVRGLREAQRLVRRWSLLRGRNREAFSTILEQIQDKGEDVCLLLNELEQKAVLPSYFSLEEMLKGIHLLQNNPDRWYVECMFGTDDEDEDPAIRVEWAVWEKAGCLGPHSSSQPPHTFRLAEIIELREALGKLYRNLHYSLRNNGKDYDRQELLLSLFLSTEMQPLVCDILLDFSPLALCSSLGGIDKVKEVVEDFGTALKNFEEDLAQVKEKPRAGTEKKARRGIAICGGIDVL